jgi:DNA-binding response OmpR family regulator/HPt (histidine-containing phosphotransfer) domain-containing protein
MRILLVEDDQLTLKAVEKKLLEQDYVVDTAMNGQVGWDLIETYSYDLIILDVILPKLDGITLCQKLRAYQHQTPVLLLTAQNSSTDKVNGLEAGADDYVVKPFEFSELLARIRVLLRRRTLPESIVLEWAGLRLDMGMREVIYNQQLLSLTPKEYRLLELFLRHPHRVFSRSDILDYLWPSEAVPSEDTVTVHIKELRRKLKQVSAPSALIETVYGHGYRLNQTEAVAVAANRLALATNSDTEHNLVHSQTMTGLATVWQKYKGLNWDRLMILEEAALKLLDKNLSIQELHKAQLAAHKLTGALGIFGFVEGSRLAREVENLLQSTPMPDRLQAVELVDLLTLLRQELEGVWSDRVAVDGKVVNLEAEAAHKTDKL